MQVVKTSRIVFICVKPQYVRVVLEEVRDLLTDEHVIVSIAAGVPIAALKVQAVPPGPHDSQNVFRIAVYVLSSAELSLEKASSQLHVSFLAGADAIVSGSLATLCSTSLNPTFTEQHVALEEA